ncbi:hypothetical protein PsAD2_01834 [Pseudovibrio axinellae]|uniref:DUF1513 domain-containing protein n=1 Tax=Pseudovibrio axinellae TaxID=989403 RepID=A0A165Z6I7_9HYPH|nr:DUF1513 domain-containing protein [Pseudovibrio axinellae]KZL19555.1 hypothetical protein PsAD2_01834 [Pseudovibrio axinellae]SEQ31784.1 hypothetical protein SAMN05421798_102395 [Pseudovibrio axinellae]
MRWTATKPISLSKRQFLVGLAASGAVLNTSASLAFANSLPFSEAEDLQLFASALRTPTGGYGIAVFSEDGEILYQIPLPDRGHAIAYDSKHMRLLSFARRPENFAVLADLTGKREPIVFTSPADRHFYGHGVFSKDSRLAFAPENDFKNARGVIGIYDVSGEQPVRIGEFESYGVGPHDLLLSPDGSHLVVANGGIQTHPDNGREKLNLASMKPSVAFIDIATGDLLAQHTLEAGLHQLSLRHMSFDGNGDVWVGGQFQGPKDTTPPLMVHLGRDKAATLLDMPDGVSEGLGNYVGSVEMNRHGDVIAASCPRGGKILYWDVERRSFIGFQQVTDGCGLAPLDVGSFAISDGNGAIRYGDASYEVTEIISQNAGISWDNHLTALGILSKT